jgi:pimeloyl-ACP methyl ester carboxylesterase
MFGWPQMDDHLGPATDVITADLPGMGSADPLPPGPGADLLRRAVLGIADDLGTPRLNVFGFSYGTAIAFGFARRHRERVARLALGGVPVHIDEAQVDCWERARQQLAAGDREGFAATAADALMCLDPERPVHRRELARRYVRRSFLHALIHSPHAADSLYRALADRPDFSGGLTGVPALVFAGEHDTVTSTPRPLGRPGAGGRGGLPGLPVLHRAGAGGRRRHAAAPGGCPGGPDLNVRSDPPGSGLSARDRAGRRP